MKLLEPKPLPLPNAGAAELPKVLLAAGKLGGAVPNAGVALVVPNVGVFVEPNVLTVVLGAVNPPVVVVAPNAAVAFPNDEVDAVPKPD